MPRKPIPQPSLAPDQAAGQRLVDAETGREFELRRGTSTGKGAYLAHWIDPETGEPSAWGENIPYERFMAATPKGGPDAL